MKLGIIMDPIQGINIKKDSSFAMLLAAQALGWEIHYMEITDLFISGGEALARMRLLEVQENPASWHRFTGETVSALDQLDIILMRKDPPVDVEYLHATQILELAQQKGVCVVNAPAALRDVNEKLFIHWFPDCIPPTLVSSNPDQIRTFLDQHKEIILKPLDGMGGTSIFHVKKPDANVNVIIEALTRKGSKYAIAQRYVPEITQGDKRILLIDGEPVPYALARIPRPGEHRGNLAAGGTGKGVELTVHDREICEQLAPVLRKKGILFAGIDVIGNYLTEINITSPTCIRELDALFKLNIARDLLTTIKKKYVRT